MEDSHAENSIPNFERSNFGTDTFLSQHLYSTTSIPDPEVLAAGPQSIETIYFPSESPSTTKSAMEVEIKAVASSQFDDTRTDIRLVNRNRVSVVGPLGYYNLITLVAATLSIYVVLLSLLSSGLLKLEYGLVQDYSPREDPDIRHSRGNAPSMDRNYTSGYLGIATCFASLGIFPNLPARCSRH
ncbi:uncharacterized protein PAC_10875 [Phialocephala subalpina]|uniref:Uncharacterized protein n=1 Tax=Phialocephala subalpina TaxID=576137 RepID=A0A1L7X7I2_9HELO|nr:uncharacterized protein PAC_10875 [Phialocephala subalpina]